MKTLTQMLAEANSGGPGINYTRYNLHQIEVALNDMDQDYRNNLLKTAIEQKQNDIHFDVYEYLCVAIDEYKDAGRLNIFDIALACTAITTLFGMNSRPGL